MRTVHTFLHDLLESLPEVGPVYDEHVRDHGTCLAHVFFGDVTKFAIAEAMRGFRQEVLVRLFNHLEQGLSSDNQDVRELINASFVENLRGETQAIDRMKLLMGPRLRAQVKEICGL